MGRWHVGRAREFDRKKSNSMFFLLFLEGDVVTTEKGLARRV